MLFFVPLIFESTEFNALTSLLVFSILFLDKKIKLSRTLISTIAPLGLIVIVGVLSSLFYPKTGIDFFKDIILFIKPILYILIGYYSAVKIRDKQFLFRAVIMVAILFATYHVIEVTLYVINNPMEINKIRSVGGKANFIELFSLVIMLLNRKHQIISKPVKYATLVKMLLIISFILYFSRTMLVGLIILTIAINGYLKLTKKGLNYMFGILLSVSILYIILYSIDIERGAKGIEGFAYKIKIAPTEIFASEINQNDHSDLWDNWRGYEVVKAFEELKATPYGIGYFNGKGFGALIDLEFVAPLNKEGIQYIPKIHNGFVNVIFKTGFIGLLLYLLFLIFVYIQAYKTSKTKREILFNNAISGIGIYFVFTSFIISGIYNQGDIFTLVLGWLLYLQHNYFNQQNEYRNIRH